jgi:hypothetical protein
VSDRPPLPPPPSQSSGCAAAVLVILGLILLLPGLCTLIISNGQISQVASIAVITFTIGFVGLILIVLGFVLGSRRP